MSNRRKVKAVARAQAQAKSEREALDLYRVGSSHREGASIDASKRGKEASERNAPEQIQKRKAMFQSKMKRRAAFVVALFERKKAAIAYLEHLAREGNQEAAQTIRDIHKAKRFKYALAPMSERVEGKAVHFRLSGIVKPMILINETVYSDDGEEKTIANLVESPVFLRSRYGEQRKVKRTRRNGGFKALHVPAIGFNEEGEPIHYKRGQVFRTRVLGAFETRTEKALALQRLNDDIQADRLLPVKEQVLDRATVERRKAAIDRIAVYFVRPVIHPDRANMTGDDRFYRVGERIKGSEKDSYAFGIVKTRATDTAFHTPQPTRKPLPLTGETFISMPIATALREPNKPPRDDKSKGNVSEPDEKQYF